MSVKESSEPRGPVGARKNNLNAYAKTYSFLLNLLLEFGVEDWAGRGFLNFFFKRIEFSDSQFEQQGLSENQIKLLKNHIGMYIKTPEEREKFKTHLDKIKNKRPVGQYFVEGVSKNRIDSTKVQFSKTVAQEVKSITVMVNTEDDIVSARYQAREVARSAGFSMTEQIKIATATSELARNIFKYVGAGYIIIEQITLPKDGICIKAVDKGNGISNMDEIIAGTYKSKTGMGLGLMCCKKLMDDFHIASGPGMGTSVTIKKYVN